jgi:hypothetical protein
MEQSALAHQLQVWLVDHIHMISTEQAQSVLLTIVLVMRGVPETEDV